MTVLLFFFVKGKQSSCAWADWGSDRQAWGGVWTCRIRLDSVGSTRRRRWSAALKHYNQSVWLFLRKSWSRAALSGDTSSSGFCTEWPPLRFLYTSFFQTSNKDGHASCFYTLITTFCTLPNKHFNNKLVQTSDSMIIKLKFWLTEPSKTV